MKQLQSNQHKIFIAGQIWMARIVLGSITW